MPFNPKEIAKINVAGVDYTEWESVWVQQRWTESFSYFKFIANEGRLQPPSWRELQFRPGQPCKVTLGGEPVINGHIITRQSSATATSHMVQHTGKSLGWHPYRSSVWTKDGNFDGKTISEIAGILFSLWDGYETLGQPTGDQAKPIEKAQAQKGEKIWDFLERLGRKNKTIIGHNARTGHPQLIFDHDADIMGHVEDGVNILQIQCTISIENMYAAYYADASKQGSDQESGEDTNGIRGKFIPGDLPVFSVLVIPMEDPPKDQAQADARAKYEAIWTRGTEITCNITVPGWFSNNGLLWEAGKEVTVFSPMAMITQTLTINTATFEQNSQKGTVTTLELVAPWSRNAQQLGANPGNPSVADGPGNDHTEQHAPVATGSPANPPPKPTGTTGGIF